MTAHALRAAAYALLAQSENLDGLAMVDGIEPEVFGAVADGTEAAVGAVVNAIENLRTKANRGASG